MNVLYALVSGGAQAISRRGSGDDSLLTNQLSVIAMSEECEARMKALDRAELIPFFNVRPDEEPAGAMKQVTRKWFSIFAVAI